MGAEYPDKKKLPGIAIIAELFDKNKVVLETKIANIVNILGPLSRELVIIAGSIPDYDEPNIRRVVVKKRGYRNDNKLTPAKILGHPLADLVLAFKLLKYAGHIDVVLYHINAKGYIMSMVLARLLRKRVVTLSFTTARKAGKVFPRRQTTFGPRFFHLQVMKLLENLSFWLSNRIWVESESTVTFSELDEYRRKISICSVSYMEIGGFNPAGTPDQRKNLVGYIGRLDTGRGVAHFVEAIPKIRAIRKDIGFLLGGGGPLFDEIEWWRHDHSDISLRLTGWIPHEDVSGYLNELKLLVLPSYSEGLPAIVLEAMASGAIVVATPVGGVPDLIKDGETGFIMEDNSPECITESVFRALEHPGLEVIAWNAREFVKREYSYEAVVMKYRKELDELVG